MSIPFAPRLALALVSASWLVGGCDDARPPADDGGARVDASVPSTDGSMPDAGADRDAAPPGVDGGPTEDPDADVELTFVGCPADFSGDVVVARDAESIAVSSTRDGALTGSVQIALHDERGLIDLSTQHRVDTGAVINVVAATTWTNIARDSAAVLSGESADPIGGRLNVREYDLSAGRVDVEFDGVTLQNPSDASVCRIDGRLRTHRSSF